MLVRPRRRRQAGDEVPAPEAGAFTVSARPRPRRSLFLAKIDTDEMVDKLKSKFPETWGALEKSEAASAMKKKFDELTNPSFQPDRRRLSAVEDFFRYTEEEGAYASIWATLTDESPPTTSQLGNPSNAFSNAQCAPSPPPPSPDRLTLDLRHDSSETFTRSAILRRHRSGRRRSPEAG